MSHNATNWAIRQRGIKPGLKVVLWHLADCHNPAFGGAFPSQEYLAEQCEVPRSTLNVYLDQLEEAGLIAREQRRRAGSQKQERTRYYFPFEAEFAQFSTAKPSPETGHGKAEAESRNGAEPSPENGESRVQNLDSNPVREPVREPVNSRERASDGGMEDDHRRAERDFKRWFASWPTFVSDSQPDALKAWLALGADERVSAVSMTEAYIAAVKASDRKYVCSAAKYLSEHRWEKLPKPEQVRSPQLVNAYSRAWMGLHFAGLSRPMRRLFFSSLEERMIDTDETKRPLLWADKCRKHGWPEVTALHERAREFKGVAVAPQIARVAEGCFDKVHVGGEVWEAWKRLHERRNWPFPPPPDRLEFVQFPAVGADEADLDQAVERALSRFWSELKEAGATDDAA